MALIPPFFLSTVNAIGKQFPGGISWLGTGFLYGDLQDEKIDGKNSYQIYLVTNKHVLANQTSIVLKFDTTNPTRPSIHYSVSLLDANGAQIWTGHPNPLVDIAVIHIDPNVIKEEYVDVRFFASDQHTLDNAGLTNEEVSEGDSIYALGFPMSLVGTQQQYVICRHGCIARIRDYIDGHAHSFLIDSTVFPGGSGGPVVIAPEITAIDGTKPKLKAYLIGVVREYLCYQDQAISQQTGHVRITFQENSGLTVVEPVEHIKQAIASISNTVIAALIPIP
jgi:hypothetical protein